MKTLAKIAAGLSFMCFFIAGAWIIRLTASSTRTEGPLPVCIGLCLIGTAFYLGPKLWLAADSRMASTPDTGASFSGIARGYLNLFRYLGTGAAVLVFIMIAITILRFTLQQ